MMKMKFQKWVAALISFVMIGIVFSMLPMTSLTASAICCRKDGFDKSKYTLTGNMAEDVATIAKSQKGRTGSQLGYTEAWCDEYVADCIENAGADSSIVGHGGTVADFESVMREKKGAVPVSSPQTGDLVFFTYSHVEIVTKVENGTVYCAGGNNGGTGDYKTNYCAGERKLYATPRLYLRPNYSRIKPDPPSYSNLQVNKSLIFAGQEITFTASSDTATGFTIGIDNETSRYITQEMPNGSLTLTFNEPGQYGAYVTSYNPYGYCDSSWISFTVAAPVAPSYSNLQANKSLIFVGEEITFTASSDTATGFTIGIDNETSRYITQEMPNGSLTLTFNEPGQYGAYVTSYNPYGYCDSSWIPFTVAAPVPPSYSNLQANRSIISVGEEIEFNALSDNATAYWIGIDHNGGRYLTKEMVNGTLKYSFTEAGIYTAYVTSSNKYGGVDSKLITFNVVDSAPTFSQLSSSTNKVLIGEEIEFNALSDNATAYWIGIDHNGERYLTKEMVNGTLKCSFTEAGVYTAYVTSSNKYGGVDSKLITFTIYSDEEEMIYNGDYNEDGKFDIADIIALQKWIIAIEDTDIVDWRAADLCQDDMLNASDLCLMKQKLLSMGE
ncbi:MAG: CHAP domain-containing protein [Ruminococcus sp.]